MGVLKLPPGGVSPERMAHLLTIDVASLPGDYYPIEWWAEPGVPVTGPAASPFGPGPTKIDTDVIHYAAAYYANGIESIDMTAHLRSINRDYTFNRGYAIGYNHFVDAFGNIWEGRGWRIRNAANSTTAPNFNVRSMSLHVVVSKLNASPNDSQAYPANQKQQAAIRWYRREQKRRAGFELALLGHRDTKPTGCPGSGLYFQIWHTEDFSIAQPVPVPVPVDPIVKKNLELIGMYQIALTYGPGTLICRVTAEKVIHERNSRAAEVDTQAGVSQVSVGWERLVDLLASRRSVGNPFRNANGTPRTDGWFDANLDRAWEAARTNPV